MVLLKNGRWEEVSESFVVDSCHLSFRDVDSFIRSTDDV